MSEDIKQSELKQFTLSLYDRIIIMSLLPTQSSLYKGLLVQDINKTINPTDEEIQKYGITYLDSGIIVKNLKEAKGYTKEFTFPDEKVRIISDAFKKADKEERLSVSKDTFELYNKFVE